MSQPFIGEIRMFGGNFPPLGWAFCDGSLLAISENDALFNLIGTTYGGDGQSTFALPDMRGRIPIHQGAGFVLGQLGGTETETISLAQYPSHTHNLLASGNPGTSTAGPTGVTGTTAVNIYGSGPASEAMAANAISIAPGGSQPHDNMAPFLCVNFIISLFGIFPSQN